MNENKTSRINIRVDEKTKARLKNIASAQGVTISQLMRDWLDFLIVDAEENLD